MIVTLWPVAVLVASIAMVWTAPSTQDWRRDSETAAITSLTTNQVSTFKPYSYFAATGYCPPNVTIHWSCDIDCMANPNFKPVAAGGDGATVQFWFVGYDPDLDEVIVSHQGTNILTIIPILTDVDILLTVLDAQLFPGADSSALVHGGFAAEQSGTAESVLTAVQNAMAEFGTNKVTTVGHSLGAAISLIDAIFLHLQLPDATVRFVGYGLPRVGIDTFANWVDTLPIEVNHIANKKDLVPILPPILLGFRHISGELHIDQSNEWENCPGHDNPSGLCTVGDTNLLLNFNLLDHPGPYDGVSMFCL